MEFLSTHVNTPGNDFENVVVVEATNNLLFGKDSSVLYIECKPWNQALSEAYFKKLLGLIESNKDAILSKFPNKTKLVVDNHTILEATKKGAELQINQVNDIYANAYAAVQNFKVEEVKKIEEATFPPMTEAMLKIGDYLIDSTWTDASPAEKAKAKKTIKIVKGNESSDIYTYTIEAIFKPVKPEDYDKEFEKSIWKVSIKDISPE